MATTSKLGQALSNSIRSVKSFSRTSALRTVLIHLAFMLLLLPPIELSESAQAQNSPQWRRTKDGWIDMTNELQFQALSASRQNSSYWATVWPAAATLSLGLTAYWLLSFENAGKIREKSRIIFENCLGRFVRPSHSPRVNDAELTKT